MNMSKPKFVRVLMIFQKILAVEVTGRKFFIKAKREECIRGAVTACSREGLDFINQNICCEKDPPLLSQQPHEVLLPHAEI